MRFEWDKNKSLRNQAKHGVSFEMARLVFDDPLHVSLPERIQDGEQRWQTLGLVQSVVVILVAHTIRKQFDDEVVRLISARKATRQERRFYEQGN